MLVIVSMMRLGEAAQGASAAADAGTGTPAAPLDDDSRDRMVACLQVLASPEPELVKVGLGFKVVSWRRCLGVFE